MRLDTTLVPATVTKHRDSKESQKTLNKEGTLMPETVIFRKNEKGEHVSRIDDLEICFYPEDGCHVIVWGDEETWAPCEVTDSICPEEKERDWRNCPVSDHCPYEKTTETHQGCTIFCNEGNRAQLEARIRTMFKTGDDGTGHREDWPKPAASRFAHAEWKFEE